MCADKSSLAQKDSTTSSQMQRNLISQTDDSSIPQLAVFLCSPPMKGGHTKEEVSGEGELSIEHL
jgi:hypothetical protein